MMKITKMTKTLIYIEIFVLISIILKVILNAIDLHVLLDLRFEIVFSLPLQLICFIILGLILGMQILNRHSSKKVFKVTYIVFCSLLIIILLFFFWLNIAFGNCRNRKEFVKVEIPNSDEIAIINTDGAVPGWIGKDTGVVCYLQTNTLFLKEVEAYHNAGNYKMDQTHWRFWNGEVEAFKNGHFHWEGYALIIELDYYEIRYDFGRYMNQKLNF